MAMEIGAAMEQQVRGVIESEIARLKEQIIKKSTSDFEEEIRKAMAFVSLTVADFYSVEHTGNELIIHVKIEAPKKDG